MSWTANRFKQVISEHVPDAEWLDGWGNTWHGMSKWRGPGGKPLALMLHHTAGASTTSTDPKDPGNKCSADDGQVRFVHRHPDFGSPASQFCLRRCGRLAVNAFLPCYHAGKGDFAGTEWQELGIPKDSANSYLMGIEIVSKGQADDLTEAQWATLAQLLNALRELAGWESVNALRTPRHKDWAPERKVDIKASRKRIASQLAKYGQLWDGKTPEYEAVKKAETEGIANPAAWRLACKLADLGYYKGQPLPKGEQGYPAKAVANYNAVHGPGMSDPSSYGPKMHERVWAQ